MMARKIVARPIMPVRLARLHARLLFSVAVGLAVTLGLAMTDWRMATKLLLGWDIGVVLYLVLVYQLMVTCGIAEIRRRADEDDEGALALLILTGISALAIMGAIVAELGIAKVAAQPRSGLGIGFAMATIVVSWAFVHTIFALHYAHEYYGETRRSYHRRPDVSRPATARLLGLSVLFVSRCDDLAGLRRCDHQ
jgi:uncharacterized membrane protein